MIEAEVDEILQPRRVRLERELEQLANEERALMEQQHGAPDDIGEQSDAGEPAAEPTPPEGAARSADPRSVQLLGLMRSKGAVRAEITRDKGQLFRLQRDVLGARFARNVLLSRVRGLLEQRRELAEEARALERRVGEAQRLLSLSQL
eukprot:6902818-Prymnesium_polylepis.1